MQHNFEKIYLNRTVNSKNFKIKKPCKLVVYKALNWWAQ